MEYKVLALCLFLCCAVLSSARSDDGSGYDVVPIPTDDEDITTGLECESAKMVYGLSSADRGGDFIFNKMKKGESRCSKHVFLDHLLDGMVGLKSVLLSFCNFHQNRALIRNRFCIDVVDFWVTSCRSSVLCKNKSVQITNGDVSWHC